MHRGYRWGTLGISRGIPRGTFSLGGRHSAYIGYTLSVPVPWGRRRSLRDVLWIPWRSRRDGTLGIHVGYLGPSGTLEVSWGIPRVPWGIVSTPTMHVSGGVFSVCVCGGGGGGNSWCTLGLPCQLGGHNYTHHTTPTVEAAFVSRLNKKPCVVGGCEGSNLGNASSVT